MFVDTDTQVEFNPIKRSSLCLRQLLGRGVFLSIAEMQGSNGIRNREGSEIYSYIKGSSMLELSCAPSINDYCQNTWTSLHAGSFKFRSKPERSSLPWSHRSYGSVPNV